MARKSPAEQHVSNAVCVADTHIMCEFGLIPGDGWALDNGGHYSPSSFQAWLWECWRDFWDRFVPEATEGEPYCVVHNGDVLDARHHGVTTLWTSNLATGHAVALAVLEPIAGLCGGRLYVIRGTEAHSGPSSEEEERIARALKAIPDPATGQHSRPELWKLLWRGQKNILVHFSHHIGTSGSEVYSTTAVKKLMTDNYTQAGKWRERPADIMVRSHRHISDELRSPSLNVREIGVVTPAWQGKTPLAHRIAIAQMKQPEIGGIIVRYSREYEPYVRTQTYRFARPDPE